MRLVAAAGAAVRRLRALRLPRGRLRVAVGLIAVAVVADVGVLAVLPVAGAQAVTAQKSTDSAVAAAPHAPPAARGAAAGIQDPAAQTTTASASGTPTRVLIPAIHVDAPLQRLARNSAGVLQPPTEWQSAGWYADGVVPGQIGAAVIAGHLDTTLREAVFAQLRLLRPGDHVEVRMSSGRTVSFTVTRTSVVQKATFPTQEIYGPTPDAELRLLTCSEPFDESQGIYADNLVVFAVADPA